MRLHQGSVEGKENHQGKSGLELWRAAANLQPSPKCWLGKKCPRELELVTAAGVVQAVQPQPPACVVSQPGRAPARHAPSRFGDTAGGGHGYSWKFLSLPAARIGSCVVLMSLGRSAVSLGSEGEVGWETPSGGCFWGAASFGRPVPAAGRGGSLPALLHLRGAWPLSQPLARLRLVTAGGWFE